ncbi:hypothetical protein CT676_39325 [Bradyrhizobium sp. MOS001]|nr:hypothetical protein CT676_39325 [Bradyrhizobium sp. MOS001]
MRGAKRRSNPESLRGNTLDCFAALAMTIVEAARGFSRRHRVCQRQVATPRRLLCMGLFFTFLV